MKTEVQLDLFPAKEGDTLCFFRPLTVEEWDYSGFKKGFTNHLWCAKHYIGKRLKDGTIKRCECACHA
jgi:hypothetical protein